MKKTSLVIPTVDTPFHIDFEWWQQNDRDWRVHLLSSLCEEHRAVYAEMEGGQLVDFVDPETAEVQQVEGLQHILISHCARMPDFITERTSLVEAVFRTFLANGNVHMSPRELSEHLQRPADLILRTISRARVYKGIRPCPEC
ncbi:MAG: hypothetical protein D6803_01875 [Anaerolineae bacterium]|nr:MAG: hypothetical protein D6803_01875 [Anaerolineae bacterium]